MQEEADAADAAVEAIDEVLHEEADAADAALRYAMGRPAAVSAALCAVRVKGVHEIVTIFRRCGFSPKLSCAYSCSCLSPLHRSELLVCVQWG